MGISVTASSTSSTPAVTALWSVDSLSAQLLGELNQDRNAIAAAPDRLKAIVVEALGELWDEYDWAFQQRQGTIELSADADSADLPADFSQMLSWVLQDPDKGETVRVVKDVKRWLRIKQGYSSDDTGSPTLAVILRDTSDSNNFLWKIHFEIKADQAYSYPFLYKALCPLDLSSDHADYKGSSDVIPMPRALHHLWHLNARWRAQSEFRTDDEWVRTHRLYQQMLLRAKTEADRPAEVMDPTQDGYMDWDATPDMLMPARDSVSRLEDT